MLKHTLLCWLSIVLVFVGVKVYGIQLDPKKILGNGFIVSTTDMHVIDSILKKASSRSLVIFDVNDTLLLPKDQILQSAYKIEKQMRIEELKKQCSYDKANDLLSVVRLSSERQVIDLNMLNVLARLKDLDIKVIGLTTAGEGSMAQIPSLMDWKLGILKKQGIDFGNSFPNVPFLRLKGYSKKHPDRYPGFKGGVIFTCSLPKGEILDEFLKKIRYHPKQIFFIDDKIKNLKSVQAFCKKEHIEFIGIEYTAVKDQKSRPLDKKLVEKQFKMLLETGVWVSE